MTEPSTNEPNEFVAEGKRKRAGMFGEMLFMVRTTRKWWMMPLIALLILLGLVMLLTSTGAGPLIYTLF